MVITDFLERNARLYGSDIALVEVNPSEERDSAVTWREASLIAEAQPDAPYRRELSWRDFDRRANRFANFLLSRNVRRGTKVGILLMNCLEWLPIYFGILKAGCIAVPLNFRYASDEISYCLDLADVEVLVFGPEFVSRLDPIQESLTRVKIRLFVGRNVPGYAEDCRRLTCGETVYLVTDTPVAPEAQGAYLGVLARSCVFDADTGRELTRAELEHIEPVPGPLSAQRRESRVYGAVYALEGTDSGSAVAVEVDGALLRAEAERRAPGAS